MTIRFLSATIACLATSAATAAQEAFTFSWEVEDVAGLGPSNANGVIEPGEDALISLHGSFRPSVGGTAVWDTRGGIGQIGTVAGVGVVKFDLWGIQNIDSGTWIEPFLRAPGFSLSPVGGIDPTTNSLFSMIFGQFPFPGQAPNPRNDDWFFRARWRPNGYSPRSVEFTYRDSDSVLHWPSVLLDVGLRDPNQNILYVEDRWTWNEPSGSFLVVPAPMTGGVALSLLWALRRHRRSIPVHNRY